MCQKSSRYSRKASNASMLCKGLQVAPRKTRDSVSSSHGRNVTAISYIASSLPDPCSSSVIIEEKSSMHSEEDSDASIFLRSSISDKGKEEVCWFC